MTSDINTCYHRAILIILISLIAIFSFWGYYSMKKRYQSQKKPLGFYSKDIFIAEYEMLVIKDAIYLYFKDNGQLPNSNDFGSLSKYLYLHSSKTKGNMPISPYNTPYYFFSLHDLLSDSKYYEWAEQLNCVAIVVCTGPDKKLDIIKNYNFLSDINGDGDIIIPIYLSLTPWGQ